ncbi:efflux RND transporter periplasmic adaptor subunit [Candidatus Gottesmanbacteria bacterium]|nr:efflux RND transporter periplasmic adaptor subunit [Candidatus Gottesmanbacteria bacterium]
MRKFFSKRNIIILLILIFLGGGSYFYQNRQKAPQYETKTIESSSLTSYISASGTINAQKYADLHFQTGGVLSWLGVSEGDTVKSWQVIATLDQREVHKQLTKALRDYSIERNKFDEAKYDTYANEPVTATISRILQNNQYNLDKAVLDVELRDLSLQLSRLSTPISGVVTHLDTPVAGVNITPATAFVVVDPNSIVFQAEVDEVDVSNVTIGQNVEVSLDSYPSETFAGTVSKISFEAVTSSSGGTTFLVDINLPYSQNLMFRPGMNGDAQIITSEKTDIIVIPFNAIVEEDEGSFVYVLENEKRLKRKVETGIEGEAEVEIVSGVNLGEVIIINP